MYNIKYQNTSIFIIGTNYTVNILQYSKALYAFKQYVNSAVDIHRRILPTISMGGCVKINLDV